MPDAATITRDEFSELMTILEDRGEVGCGPMMLAALKKLATVRDAKGIGLLGL